jgi:hypothetical protein
MEGDLKQRVRDRYAGAARSVLGEAEDDGSYCGVAESGDRAALEVEMACGSYSEAECCSRRGGWLLEGEPMAST